MATYNLTTSTQAEEALTVVVAKRNQERVAQEPPLPALSNSEYVALIWNDVLTNYIAEAERDETAKLVEAYRDPAKRADIKAAAKI